MSGAAWGDGVNTVTQASRAWCTLTANMQRSKEWCVSSIAQMQEDPRVIPIEYLVLHKSSIAVTAKPGNVPTLNKSEVVIEL